MTSAGTSGAVARCEAAIWASSTNVMKIASERARVYARWALVIQPPGRCRPSCRTAALERVLETELHRSRVSRARHCAEGAGAKVPVRSHEIHIIERVERFYSELELLAFGDTEVLHEAEVQALE